MMVAMGAVRLALGLLLLAAAPATPVLVLTPLWLPDFILEPGVPSAVRFAVAGPTPLPSALTFRGQDYRGTVPDGGWPASAPLGPNATATLTLNHSIGYSSYSCVQTNQTFGFVVAPRLPRPFDDRFAVVAGFTQICNTVHVDLREPMLTMLTKIGVGHYRDFPQMGLARPNRTTYDWNRTDPAGLAGRMEQLHELNRKLGMKVLDCFGGTESWNRRAGWHDARGGSWRWGKDLVAAAEGFTAAALRWGDTQAGIEADNEVDAMPYTADQYSVWIKTIRWGLHQASLRKNASAAPIPPLVCGAFTDAVHSGYLDLLGRNQVSRVCDAMSYHSYTNQAAVQDDIARVRLWQAQWNASGMPLLISESGADFALRWNSTGRPRPSLVQGRAYAWGDVAHQIENIGAFKYDISLSFLRSFCQLFWPTS